MGNDRSNPESPLSYPNFGLPCSLEVMDRTFPTLHTKTVEEQAKYADAVCKHHIGNEQWLTNQMDKTDRILREIGKSVPFKQFNSVSVGNLAYVALNAPTEKLKNRHLVLLQDWNNWKAESLKRTSSINNQPTSNETEDGTGTTSSV
jgi:hypothetical protein